MDDPQFDPLSMMPPAVPQVPPVAPLQPPQKTTAERIAPLAVMAAALALGKNRGGGALAGGYAQAQIGHDQRAFNNDRILHEEALRQNQLQQQSLQQQAVLEQRREQQLMGAVSTIKAKLGTVTDKKVYDQQIDAYSAVMQQAGMRMTPNLLRTFVPFVAPDAKKIAGDAVSAWLKNPANVQAMKADPTLVSRAMLRIDTNGDGIAENVPLMRAGELGGIQFASDENGNMLGAIAGADAKIGSQFQELLKAKRARFIAENKREPSPKEQEDLITKTLKEAKEANQTTDEAIPPERVAASASAILEHRMAPSQLTLAGGSMGKQGANFRQAVMAEVLKQNPKFNFAEAESNYAFGKSTGTQNTVRFLDNIEKTLPVLEQASADFKRSGIRIVNKATLAAKSQFGSTDVVKFEFARNILADEIAKVLQGGGSGSGTSDAKLRQAQELLSGDMTPDQLLAVTASARELLGSRRGALTKGTYMERPEAAPADPRASAKAKLRQR